jgi:hypothetical protein
MRKDLQQKGKILHDPDLHPYAIRFGFRVLIYVCSMVCKGFDGCPCPKSMNGHGVAQ